MLSGSVYQALQWTFLNEYAETLRIMIQKNPFNVGYIFHMAAHAKYIQRKTIY